jgi:signal peptidase I
MIKKRNPFAALLLSIIPGLGQIYNGQLKKALVFLTIDLLVPIIFGVTGLLNNLNGLVALVTFSLSFIVYRMIDGFVQGRKLIHYKLKSHNKWYVYLSFFIGLVVVRTFLDLPASTGIQPFKISSPSMHPTMQPEDRVVASLSIITTTQFNRET